MLYKLLTVFLLGALAGFILGVIVDKDIVNKIGKLKIKGNNNTISEGLQLRELKKKYRQAKKKARDEARAKRRDSNK